MEQGNIDGTHNIAPREGARIRITLNANSATMLTAIVGAEVVRMIPAITDAMAFVPIMIRLLFTGSGFRELPSVAYTPEVRPSALPRDPADHSVTSDNSTYSTNHQNSFRGTKPFRFYSG